MNHSEPYLSLAAAALAVLLSSAIVDGDTVRCGDITFTVAIVTGEAAPAAE